MDKKRPIARALHKFIGQYEHELTFSPGEAILLLRRVDDNWLEGELDGRIGIFPANRVRVEVGSPSLSHESALARSGRPCGVVLHDFSGNMDGDLPLEEGQIVELLGTITAGWMRGRINNNIGIFPSSFIEVVQPLTVTHKSVPVPKPRTKKYSSPSVTEMGVTPSVTGKGGSLSVTEMEVSSVTEMGVSSNTDNEHKSTCEYTTSTDSLDVYTTISSITQDITELNTSLQAEEKMLQSTMSLLEVCQDDDAQVRLSESLELYQNNVELYKEKLKHLEIERDSLLSRVHEVSSPVIPPSPVATCSHDDTLIKRQRVIQELYETERDYYYELTILSEKVLPSFKKWKFIKYDAIFCNIEEVTTLSGQLTQALKCVVDDPNMNGIGDTFKTFADKIRNVYGVYCHGQDSASQLLEKLMEDEAKAETIRKFFNLGRPNITSWDLHTLLIKPVQRIVKYPLLLSNILKATPPDYEEYKSLSSAVMTSSQVAQDINEIRRRKDIVERYTGSGRDERRVNFGTLRKKVRRLNQSFIQKTGLRTATVDAKYDKEETKVLALENTLRTFQQNILTWQEDGQRLLECRDILLSAVTLYTDDNNSLSQNCIHVLENVKQEWIQQNIVLQDSVINPLIVLIDLFHDPVLLMNKRGDKLLDYDSLQHNLDKTTEIDKIESLREQVILAKRTYEALNTQLLVELPLFIDKVNEAIMFILLCFIKHQTNLHHTLSGLLSQTDCVGDIINSQSILTDAMYLLQDVSNDLGKLSIVPATLGVAFGHRGGPRPSSPPLILKTTKRTRQLSMPTKQQQPLYEEIPSLTNPMTKSDTNIHEYDSVPVDTTIHETIDTPEDPAVHTDTTLEDLAINTAVTDNDQQITATVLYNYKSDNDLSVITDDIVILLSTDGEWCLIEKDQMKGYIPTNYLQQY